MHIGFIILSGLETPSKFGIHVVCQLPIVQVS